ncbi:MAG TPA: hypothetical protein VFD92_11535 [Candidatus Binatia bacterium]|nr:hypothetical protein [Candidatus Binatia bacterium]
MAMRMLAAGGVDVVDDGARPADAANPHGYFEDARAKRLRDDATWLTGCVGRAVKIVLPLLPYVPRGIACDVIVLRRALGDVLASQRALLALAGSPPSDAGGDEATLAASFERSFAAAAAWWNGRPDVRTLNLDYDAVVGDPASAAGSIAEFLARPLDRRAMARAVDRVLSRGRRLVAEGARS